MHFKMHLKAYFPLTSYLLETNHNPQYSNRVAGIMMSGSHDCTDLSTVRQQTSAATVENRWLHFKHNLSTQSDVKISFLPTTAVCNICLNGKTILLVSTEAVC